jgi:hypothetical protein
MQERMGIYDNVQDKETYALVASLVKQYNHADVYPDAPVLPTDQMQQIVAYYRKEAPEKHKILSRPAIRTGLTQFAVAEASYKASPPSTSLVKIDSATRSIFLGDIQTRSLYFLTGKGAVTGVEEVGEGPCFLRISPAGLSITVVGSFVPRDHPTGALLRISDVDGRRHYDMDIDNLQRPVHADYADLNGDGREDIIVCEFGNNGGVLAWHEGMGGGQFGRHVLKSRAGAVRAIAHDLNRDGKKDIIALMAQADEGFFLFENQGGGKFTERRIMQFPPTYGSTYFELVDFNADGHQDILFTNGDNGDYKLSPKPYHGIRLLANDGHGGFQEAFFYPLHGAYKASAVDFDKDGDLDIAAISFFPDYKNAPEESFVYLQNNGKKGFTASTFPDPARGRWMVMDTGDLDSDGDTDIVLGACVFETNEDGKKYESRWRDQGVALLILKNKTF